MARLSSPVAAEPMRLAVIADPHLSTERSGGTRQLGRTAEFLADAIRDVNRREVDLAVSPGDLTIDAAPHDFDHVDELLAELEPPFVSVPGNHDVRKDGYDHDVLSLPRFAARYTPGSLPFCESVGEIDVLGLNTATAPDGRLSDGIDGFVSAEQLDWLRETLRSSSQPVVLVHHNLPAYAGQFGDYQRAVGEDPAPSSTIRNADAVIRELDAGDAPIVLSGHHHVPGIGRENGTTEIAAPSLCQFPQGYLLVDVDRRGTTVRYVPTVSRDDGETAYIERAVREGDRAKMAVAAITFSQFPLREEWTPDTG